MHNLRPLSSTQYRVIITLFDALDEFHFLLLLFISFYAYNLSNFIRYITFLCVNQNAEMLYFF